MMDVMLIGKNHFFPEPTAQKKRIVIRQHRWAIQTHIDIVYT